ncbi:MAG: beta-lactamase domain protein [Clostridiales bacterium]|jgi:competence protein ComEC|nr:beta-lactamase domain protein [Clostridiales bacterium]
MKRKPLLLIFSLIFLSIFLFACSINDLEQVLDIPNKTATQTTTSNNDSTNTESVTTTTQSENGTTKNGLLKVNFIDVGQGDSIFIILPNSKSILIDAGESDSYENITKIIDSSNITKIDVLIATHPHADHIGGMDEIIENYEIGKIYMPKISSSTTTFENLLQTISDKNLKITTATAGMSIELDDSVNIDILGPNSSNYDDINNFSIIIKLTYNNNSFLFTGDAESVSEKELLQNQYDLKADILKVGHHGSSSSTSASLLKAVEPTYAIISVGKDNAYGHPKQKLLDRLADYGVTTYRTDELGTISVTSDGENIEIIALKKDEE